VIKQQFGVIGLGVMGKSLSLNIEDKGFSVAVYNRSSDKTKVFEKEVGVKNFKCCYSIEEFTSSLETPRKILMMIKDGKPTDDIIEALKPHLSKGDILIDAGNSYFKDTIRRTRTLEDDGFRYIGAGVSGGEEGALKGPAIMPGGQRDAYDLVEPIFLAICARVDGEPCCDYIGEDGAGHYVKMVHNGIEYADMQLIAEAYFILKNTLGLTPKELQGVFGEWNKGELNSYLIEITSDIFSKKDEVTDEAVVDIILDSAGQKGTGKWTSQSALDLGVPAPSIAEAVFARYISSIKEERVAASRLFKTKADCNNESNKTDFIEAVRKALYASKICAYAQGFALLKGASTKYGWELNYGKLATIFRGGCIIRAQFLNKIKAAYDENSSLSNLMIAPYFKGILENYQIEWRQVVTTSILQGIPVPGFSSSLTYFDSYKSETLPANLIQAQRDYFGAHTFERIDTEGHFHNKWY
jgi:6-phosphogluconate dehydrogenase